MKTTTIFLDNLEQDLAGFNKNRPEFFFVKVKLAALFAFLIIVTFIPQSHGQVMLKSEYIGASRYKSAEKSDSHGRGQALVVKGAVQFPIAMKSDTLIRAADTLVKQSMWSIGMDGSYTKLENHNMQEFGLPGEIINARLGLKHVRTLNKKWPLMASLGAGLYSSPAHISADRIIGEGAVIFVRQILSNLKIGAGIALDNTFGFPMVYPGIIVDWAVDGKNGKYYVRVNSSEIKVGARYSDTFSLSILCEGSGALVLEKDRMFTHQYYTVGLTPEFKIGNFKIPVTAGISTSRQAYSHDRKLTDFFSYMTRDDLPHFALSPYVAVGISYGI